MTVADLTEDELRWLEARRATTRAPLPDDELIRLYKRDMERRGLRETGIGVVLRSLRQASREIEGGLQCVDYAPIEAWLDAKMTRKRHGVMPHPILPQSRNWTIYVLRSFYRWAIEFGYLEKNPTALMRPGHYPRPLPRPIPDKELLAALDQADDRMRCWLLLGCMEGMRCQEIAGLAREDILEGDMNIRVVHGKGGKERLIPLHPDVLDALERYGMPARGPIFLRPDGWRESANHVSHTVSKHLHDVGSDSTAHTLRHWYATKAYSRSRDLRLVQELLGHSSPTTTAVYTRISGSRGRSTVNGLRVPGRRTRAKVALVGAEGEDGA
jgi:integrase/recombinase XerC